MSPETYPTAERMIEQAYYIKDELTGIQGRANEAANASLDADMQTLEERDEIIHNPADISDLRDQRVAGVKQGFAARLLARRLPLSEQSAETTRQGIEDIENVLRGRDDRMLFIHNACSMHDIAGTLDYIKHTKELEVAHSGELLFLHRIHLEKPRTTAGWKGAIYDPELNEFLEPENIPQPDHSLGIILGRMLLNQVTHGGHIASMERFDPQMPQYINGLISHSVLGARSSQDPNGRALHSLLSGVSGIKHPTNGSLEEGVNAIESVSRPHSIIGESMMGPYALYKSTGNPNSYMILRGGNINGKSVPNYTHEHVEEELRLVDKRAEGKDIDLIRGVVIDASHDNSEKDFTKQIEVVEDVSGQVGKGQFGIKGIMVESNLVGSRQTPPTSKDKKDLVYGQSITDGCVDLIQLEQMVCTAAKAVKERRGRL